SAVQAPHAAPRVLDAHVLVIDDDEAILLGMAELLRSWGCTCDVAPGIGEGLALARQRPPDLLVTDYRLREQRTGLQAIAELHAALGRPAPTVLITGDTAPDRLREATEHGVTLLHKPVSPALLYRALAEALPARRGDAFLRLA
ncbi:MAG: response regulator, partial [Variovorax sp.]